MAASHAQRTAFAFRVPSRMQNRYWIVGTTRPLRCAAPFFQFRFHYPQIWGVRSSLRAIPNALNSKRYGTVLVQLRFRGTACKHKLSFSFVYDGGGTGKGGVGTLSVDGKSASTLVWFEGIDVGADNSTPVDD